MPLIKTDLQKDLEYIFTNFCKDIDDVAEQWGNAINNYASKITPPSLTATPAKEAFQAEMKKINLVNGLIQLPLAFDKHATVLASGMTPAFTGVKPPAPIIFAPVFAAGLAGASAKECSILMSDIIDLWYKTGTAINNASGATVPWS